MLKKLYSSVCRLVFGGLTIEKAVKSISKITADLDQIANDAEKDIKDIDVAIDVLTDERTAAVDELNEAKQLGDNFRKLVGVKKATA